LANRHVSVEWDDDGALTSVHSLDHGRELLTAGRGVELELAPDHPTEYDAWDLESWTRRLARPITGPGAIEVIDRGPLVGAVRVSRIDGPSTFVVTYRLAAESARLDIVVEVDWRHDEHLLSMAFPLAVHTDHATCDIQLGHVRRPTHASSSWDAAKFEVCAHRYVDLAEPSFGVAVLNDGRYGHAVQGDAVRVSLLRAAKYPDPKADHGSHVVTLSLLAHGPGLHAVLAAAEALNRPVRVVARGQSRGVGLAVVGLDAAGVDVDAVKGADDGSGDLVVRVHEAAGDRTSVRLSFARPAQAAWRCSLLEDAHEAVTVDGGEVFVDLRPFELLTLRVRPADADLSPG
jgi:alpha-mannosidase